MPRAKGNDLCEIFGYAPDDRSNYARKQWKSQDCPFVGNTCVKHSHPQEGGTVVVYGTCSVANKTRTGLEEVIVCPQRLYAEKYETLRTCAIDAIGHPLPTFLASEYSKAKRAKRLPKDLVVFLGQNSGGEVQLSNPGIIQLSLDWVLVRVTEGVPVLVAPCEVQSIDTTGNYHNNWRAYAEEKPSVPDSKHGMNWANVWKRLIPQLILKSSIAATSQLCKKGMYFILPDRVYMQFEKLVGKVPAARAPGHGVLTVMTYGLGPDVPPGQIRPVELRRQDRMSSVDFAKAFASGKQMPLGSQLDQKVIEILQGL
jgi:hypothetical protein